MIDTLDVSYDDFRSGELSASVQRLRRTARGRPVSIDVLPSLQSGREPGAEYGDPLSPIKRQHRAQDVLRSERWSWRSRRASSRASPSGPAFASAAATRNRGSGITYGAPSGSTRRTARIPRCASRVWKASRPPRAIVTSACSQEVARRIDEGSVEVFAGAVFGVPTRVADSEIFFGSDRPDALEGRLARAGAGRPTPGRWKGGEDMTVSERDPATRFRELHAPGQILVLPNVWDAASARLVDACGAKAIATTSAGLSWAHGYPDGEVLPARALVASVAEILRVTEQPVSVDLERGYAAEPHVVAEHVSALIDVGVVGINLEDGLDAPERLETKIAVARRVAARAGIDLFVNARTDVFRSGIAAPGRAVEETISRARRYREAGCDGIFVPALCDPEAIRAIADAIDAPLNVMARRDLPPVAELRRWGVRRVSAGAALCQAVLGRVRRAAAMLLETGLYDELFDGEIAYAEMNALLSPGRPPSEARHEGG